jgi:DNA-binding GntR family transcriptional regulator
VEGRLSRQFRVGQPTVREALKTLENEGLITRERNRGCSVTSFTVDQMSQIFRLRIEWEALAAELAVENRENWQPEELLRVSHELREAAREGDLRRFLCCDIDFHKTLWRLSGNPFLEKALSQISIPVLAFGALAFNPVRHEGIAAEHERIALAVVSGDSNEAKRVARLALERFRKIGVEEWNLQSKAVEVPV